MKKRHRKIRELRAGFVTKLTKQTKALTAQDYVRTPDGRLRDEAYCQRQKLWVATYNKWYQYVGRNPKQSADQIRSMTVSQKNKFFFSLTHDYVVLNPYGNHFEEKFCMVVFVLSKPRTNKNIQMNGNLLRNSFQIMQDTIHAPVGWESRTFQDHCIDFRERLNKSQE